MSDIVTTIALSIITALLGWLIKAVYSLTREVAQIESRIVEKVGALVDKEKSESVLSHRRHGVTDRIVSKIAERDYDSRILVETGEIPDIHPKLARVIHGRDNE